MSATPEVKEGSLMQRVGLPSVIVLAVFSWLLLVAPALAAPRVDGFADVLIVQ